MITKLIDNFGGRLVRDNIGDMNSGLAKYSTTFGNDPFSNPGNLTWFETATQIDPSASVITDLIMAGKERVETVGGLNITYVYAIGHTGRLYKIQVNDPTTYNPNYDNPVLLATLSVNSPTFTAGGSMEFFGNTEQIYIGHDMGVTKINFDGTNEAQVGVKNSWTQTVPRPLKGFGSITNGYNLYAGNGTNIASIAGGGTVSTYGQLSPAFPVNTQVRDMDLSPDGLYLEMVVTRLALPNLTSIVQDTTFLANSESYLIKWNGSDVGYTSMNTFPSFSLNANIMFGGNQYTFGYDIAGAAVFNPTHKILTPIFTQAPLPNAIGSNGNLVGWATPEYSNGFLKASQFLYGSLDNEIRTGWWREFQFAATGTETDVVRIPFQMLVSNFGIGSSSNGYAGGVFALGKQYFSTLETSASPTTKYKLYKWFPVPTTTGTAIGGVYETQNETSVKLFRNILKKRLKVTEVRVFGEGWVTNNSFKIDLIGENGTPITNGSFTFTAGTTLTVGVNTAKFNPVTMPTSSLGVRVTNLGSKNFVIDKIEVDLDEVGA